MANLMPETADPQQEEKYVSYFQRHQNDQQNEIYSIVFPMADGHIPSIHMFINWFVHLNCTKHFCLVECLGIRQKPQWRLEQVRTSPFIYLAGDILRSQKLLVSSFFTYFSGWINERFIWSFGNSIWTIDDSVRLYCLYNLEKALKSPNSDRKILICPKFNGYHVIGPKRP